MRFRQGLVQRLYFRGEHPVRLGGETIGIDRLDDQAAGGSDLLQGQGGVLVDERSVSNLVSALEEVLADESRRVAMGRFNQARARREYAYSAVAPRLAELYSQLV